MIYPCSMKANPLFYFWQSKDELKGNKTKIFNYSFWNDEDIEVQGISQLAYIIFCIAYNRLLVQPTRWRSGKAFASHAEDR